MHTWSAIPSKAVAMISAITMEFLARISANNYQN